jgi:hypothetical protein
VTHTGDGLEFTVDYAYAYDAQRRPLTKTGRLTIDSGVDAGRTFLISSTFTYY